MTFHSFTCSFIKFSLLFIYRTISKQEGEIINVIYEITAEWLYGANDRGEYGQFPANFIEHVPQNLPLRK